MSVETEANALWDDFTGFWSNTVWPGLKNLFRVTVTNEVTALAPIAESVVSTVEYDLKGVASLSGAATVIGGVFSLLRLHEAEAAAVSAGAASLVTAVSSALGNLFSTTAAVSPAALPEPSPAPSDTAPATPPASTEMQMAGELLSWGRPSGSCMGVITGRSCNPIWSLACNHQWHFIR